MRKLIICIFMVLGGCLLSFAQHPSLLFTQEEVNEMREGKGTVPAFDKTLGSIERSRCSIEFSYLRSYSGRWWWRGGTRTA